MAGGKYVLREAEQVFCLPAVPEDTPEEMLEGIRSSAIGGYRIETVVTGRWARCKIFPHYKRRGDVPEKPKRQRSAEEIAAANERRSIQRGIDLLTHNFADGDMWITETWDNAHLPEDDEGQMRDAKNFIRRCRRLHLKKGGSAREFKYYGTLEADAAEDVRPNLHLVLRSCLTMDEVEGLWHGGGRQETRRVVTDENGLTGLAVYVTKPAGKRKRRWFCSLGLARPPVHVADHKTTKSQVRRAAESRVSLEEYIAKLYPGWEVTQVADPAYGVTGGVYLYARLRVPEEPAGRVLYLPDGRKEKIPPGKRKGKERRRESSLS